MKYKAPVYEGKPQFVPVCLKSKDVFVGHILALNEMLLSLVKVVDITNEDFLYEISRSNIDSSRFNDILPNYVQNLTGDEFKEKEKERIKEILDGEHQHPENDWASVNEDSIYEIDCECGNSLVIKSIDDIPENDYKCILCERLLIQYIHVYDHEIERENIGE